MTEEKRAENRRKKEAQSPYIPREPNQTPVDIIQISGHETVANLGRRIVDDMVGESITPQMKIVAQLGRVAKYATPNDLLIAAAEYFQWAINNPIEKQELIKGGMMAGQRGSIDIPRPFSIGGLINFIGLTIKEWKNYKEGIGFEHFHDFVQRIETFCLTQKFEHAAVGIYNANIIARDLGLVDKSESKVEEKKEIIIGMRIIED